MIVSEVITRVTRQFGDEANVQIDSADVIRWINDAQREIVRNNDLLQTKGTAAVVAGTAEYSLPADLLTLHSIRYKNMKLQALSQQEADAYEVSEEAASAEPTHFWLWARKFTLYPTPNVSGAADLTIFYTKQPTEIAPGATGAALDVPLQYHNRVVEYCLAQAYELDENWQAAQMKQAQFETGIDRLKDNTDWEQRDFYPTITELPDWDAPSYMENW